MSSADYLDENNTSRRQVVISKRSQDGTFAMNVHTGGDFLKLTNMAGPYQLQIESKVLMGGKKIFRPRNYLERICKSFTHGKPLRSACIQGPFAVKIIHSGCLHASLMVYILWDAHKTPPYRRPAAKCWHWPGTVQLFCLQP